MANYSNFVYPNYQIDSFPILRNLNATDYINAKLLNDLRAITNPTSDQIAQINSLTIALQDNNVSPDIWNTLTQGLVNMEQLILKLVNFQDMGAWVSGTIYKLWNSVTLNGQTYISKQDNNSGNTPVGGTSDVWWGLAAAKGATGNTGATGTIGPSGLGNCTYSGVYSGFTHYSIGNVVLFNSILYYCIQATTGGTDPSNGSFWSVFLSSPSSTIISSSSPISPTANQTIWLDTTINIFKYWNGTTWIPLISSAISDGTITFTPTDINNIKTNGTNNSNQIMVLNGASGNYEKANKVALDTTNSNLAIHVLDVSHVAGRIYAYQNIRGGL